MQISGLSNQWQTRDGLLDSFVRDLSAHSDAIMHEHCGAIQTLILHLETLDGPDVWIGTSHRQLNFLLCDARESMPPFLTVESFDIQLDPPQCGYRIGFSLTGADTEYHDIPNVADAGAMIQRLLRGAGG